jgi:transcription antitermination factor NusG
MIKFKDLIKESFNLGKEVKVINGHYKNKIGSISKINNIKAKALIQFDNYGKNIAWIDLKDLKSKEY